MTPVTQTKFVAKNSKGEIVQNGNCMAACIATWLDLPIHEVPNIEIYFQYEKFPYYWIEVLHAYLQMKGLAMFVDQRFEMFHNSRKWDDSVYEQIRDKYYLVSGMTPRGFLHMCIYQNGKLVWDPYPSREGVDTFEEFQIIEQL